MKRLSAYLMSIAAAFALTTSPLVAFEDTMTQSGSVEDTYRIANFVVAYSTPQERAILLHYPDTGMLPASYQTARLVRVHSWMQTLASSITPVEMIRISSEAVFMIPVSELVAIETIGEDSNGVGVYLTVHTLDVRTNLQLIASLEEALSAGNEAPEAPEWRNLVDDNPWRREMHRWRKEAGAWRKVDDRVAMLKAR
jgi:hypothetical protein